MSSPALNSHADLFVVNVSLGAQPDSGFLRDFSSILVVDTLTNSPMTGRSGATSITGNGSIVDTVSEGEASTLSATAFSAAARAVLQRIFEANIHPSSVTFLSVSIGGGDTVADMPAALQAANKPYYWVVPCTTDIDDATFDIPMVVEGFNTGTFSATVIAGTGVGTISQSDIDTHLGAMSAGNQERLYMTFNSGIATGNADFAEIAAIYASVDYDNNAPGGNLSLTASAATSIATAAFKTLLRDNNINFAGPISGAASYVDAGVMFNARPIYQVIFGDVIQNRVQVDIMQVKAGLAARVPPEKLPMTRTGQALVTARLDARIQSYQRAGHILDAQEARDRSLTEPYVRAKTITTDMITNRFLEFDILQYHLDDARKITVNINVV